MVFSWSGKVRATRATGFTKGHLHDAHGSSLRPERGQLSRALHSYQDRGGRIGLGYSQAPPGLQRQYLCCCSHVICLALSDAKNILLLQDFLSQ